MLAPWCFCVLLELRRAFSASHPKPHSPANPAACAPADPAADPAAYLAAYLAADPAAYAPVYGACGLLVFDSVFPLRSEHRACFTWECDCSFRAS